MFDPSLTMVKQTYAFCLDDLWFRGIVTDVNLTNVKVSLNIIHLQKKLMFRNYEFILNICMH